MSDLPTPLPLYLRRVARGGANPRRFPHRVISTLLVLLLGILAGAQSARAWHEEPSPYERAVVEHALRYSYGVRDHNRDPYTLLEILRIEEHPSIRVPDEFRGMSLAISYREARWSGGMVGDGGNAKGWAQMHRWHHRRCNYFDRSSPLGSMRCIMWRIRTTADGKAHSKCRREERLAALDEGRPYSARNVKRNAWIFCLALDHERQAPGVVQSGTASSTPLAAAVLADRRETLRCLPRLSWRLVWRLRQACTMTTEQEHANANFDEISAWYADPDGACEALKCPACGRLNARYDRWGYCLRTCARTAFRRRVKKANDKTPLVLTSDKRERLLAAVDEFLEELKGESIIPFEYTVAVEETEPGTYLITVKSK